MSRLPISVPPKRLSESITSAASSFKLNNVTGWSGTALSSGDLGTEHYVTFRNPTGTQFEIMKIDPSTIASASITISARGLPYDGSSDTETSARKFAWTANETIVELGTHVPHLLANYVTKDTAQTISAVKTFSASAQPIFDSQPTPTDDKHIVTKKYADDLAIAGAPDASTTVAGLAEEATEAEIDANTAAGSVARLFVNPSTLVLSKYGVVNSGTLHATNNMLVSQLGYQRGQEIYAADAGSTDTYAITLSPVPAAYATGMHLFFKPNTRNTGAATLNVNTLGAKTIKKEGTLDLADGDMEAGCIYEVVYDGTNFQLMNPKGSVPVGAAQIWLARTAPSGWLLCDGTAVSRTTYAALFAVFYPSRGTVTITIAAPGVVSLTTHGLATGDGIYLTTTSALPTGLTANTKYWVIKNDADSFWLATSLANALAGTKITTSGSQSGVHTLFEAPYGVGDGTTTFNLPNTKGAALVGLDQTQSEFAGLGQTGGAKTHTLTVAEMPSHNHTGTYYSSGAGGTNIAQFTTTNGTPDTANVVAQGGGGAHNNIQPYLTINVIVKY